MRVFQSILIFIIFFSNIAWSQTAPNFKPFTKNLELAKANEGALRELLDTTLNRFLSIANDSTSDVHKSIQSEFDFANHTGRLQSYRYPKKLKKNHIIIQFVSWSNENGILGEDSAWRSESLDAIIFIPVMYEDPHGQSAINLCFTTKLDIYIESKIQDGKSEKPRTSLTINKIDFTDILLKKEKP
jgi:hypothetical protein